MAKIHLEGMEFYAYHGCFHEEQLIGTHFLIDMVLSCNISGAETSDRLSETINYQDVYRIVSDEMEEKSHLIEHVGRRISDAVKQAFPQIDAIEIKIAKLHPPLGGKVKQVAITLHD
jgi:7,8-dihydroneopterin aldolase/epimerase/oxygenase